MLAGVACNKKSSKKLSKGEREQSGEEKEACGEVERAQNWMTFG
jgi:hypothetical protein